jgi:hypothetical protein
MRLLVICPENRGKFSSLSPGLAARKVFPGGH